MEDNEKLDIMEEIYSALAGGLMDKSQDEIMSALDAYDLSPGEVTDILDMIDDIKAAESVADENTAQSMADEDNTNVTVTEEDSDGDGDADKVTLEKETPEDDGEEDYSDVVSFINSLSDEEDDPHDEGLAGETTLEEDLMMNPDMSPTEYSAKAAEKRGAKKGEPAPDLDLNNVLSDRTQKNIIGTLSQYRW